MSLLLLSLLLLSHFEFLSFVTLLFFMFLRLAKKNFVEFCNFYFYLFFFVTIWVYDFGHNLSFWVLSQCVIFSFVTIWTFKFCHKLGFWFVTIWVFEFVTICVFELCHNFKDKKYFFLNVTSVTTVTTVTTVTQCVTIWVLEFDHNFSIVVLSQLKFFSFVTICVF